MFYGWIIACRGMVENEPSQWFIDLDGNTSKGETDCILLMMITYNLFSGEMDMEKLLKLDRKAVLERMIKEMNDEGMVLPGGFHFEGELQVVP